MFGKDKSFTILESLLTAAIFSIVFAATIVFLTAGGKGWGVFSGSVDLQDDGRKAMDFMIRDLRGMVNITNCTNTNNSIIFNTTNETGVYYYRQNSQLMRGSAVKRNNISALSFCWCQNSTCDNCATARLNSTFLQINVTAGKTVRGRSLFFNITERVKLRNPI